MEVLPVASLAFEGGTHGSAGSSQMVAPRPIARPPEHRAAATYRQLGGARLAFSTSRGLADPAPIERRQLDPAESLSATLDGLDALREQGLVSDDEYADRQHRDSGSALAGCRRPAASYCFQNVPQRSNSTERAPLGTLATTRKPEPTKLLSMMSPEESSVSQ